MSGDSDEKPSSLGTSRQLGVWERVGALATGTIMAAVAFVALFRTDNDAGTAVALVVAATLLLIGIQGTQLIRLGSGEHSVELARRRDYVAAKASELASEAPEQAGALIDGYAVGDPGARDDVAVMRAFSLIYEQMVRLALTKIMSPIGWDVTTPRREDNLTSDLVIQGRDQAIAIEILSSRSPSTDRLRKLLERYHLSIIPRLIVTSSPAVPKIVANIANRIGTRAEVVYWREGMPDFELRAALSRLGVRELEGPISEAQPI